MYGSKSEEYEAVAGPPELSHALLSQEEIGKKPHNWQSNEIQQQLPTEILLITANDHEFRACYSFMKNVIRSWKDSLGMVDFGQFGDVKVALILCHQQGPIAAAIAVKNGADILNPKAVLFVGICATMNPAKAKLGDVVISAKLATYADKKVKEDGTMEHRGIKANVSPKMSRLILSADHGWQPPLKDVNSLGVEVHRDGVMLSGPELVNNLVRRQELAADFPDALGLEMEGAGLYAAAYDLGIEWAVIKGVSDYADGSKAATEDWQPFSSVMAVSVVYNMLKNPDFIREWPHYKNAKPEQCTETAPDSLNATCTECEVHVNNLAIDDSPECGGQIGQPQDEADSSGIQKSIPELCGECVAKEVSKLPDDRDKWPIHKIENGYLDEICKLLDLEDRSNESLLVALGCFSTNQADLIKQEFKPSGRGMAKKALDLWGTSERENNVGALKKILQDTMKRMDVLTEIEDWNKLHVCHGCGVKLSQP